MAVLLGHPVRRADGGVGRATGSGRRGRAVRRSSRWPPRPPSERVRRSCRPLRGGHGADPVPGREHELQRLPAPRRDPGRGRLHATPIRVPRRPARVLMGHRAAGRDRVRAAVGVRRRHPRADPALLGRACSCASRSARRAWSGTGASSRTGLAVAARVNAFGGVLTAVVLGIVVFEKFARRRLPRRDPRARSSSAMMLFINRQYARSRGASSPSGPTLVVGPPIREERVVVPIPGLDRATVQAIKVGRSIDDDVRAVFISDDPDEAATGPRALRAAGPGRPAGRRRIAVSRAGRAAPRLPRRPRHGLAARQARADHVRGHPRVRRQELVGAAPLQPVGETAAIACSSGDRTRSSSTCRTGARTPTRRRRRARHGQRD